MKQKYLLVAAMSMLNSSRVCNCLKKTEFSIPTNKPSFYERIGSPKFISAPMVDQSELAWRLMTRRNGADLAFTQMIHAKNFANDKRYRGECIDWENYTHSSSDMTLTSEAEKIDRNIIIQLAGDDSTTLIAAGRFFQHRAAAIDLNLGCPQKIAKKGHYGAYLLTEPALVVKLLAAMVQGLDCPITAKIRALPNDEDTIALCREIEKCGVQMITVHGRTVESSKMFTGPANWDIIRKVKNCVNIPVIANGGVSCRDDALRCLAETGADAVMSSEALLENPKLFSEEGDRLFRDDYVRTQLRTVDEYMETVTSHAPPRPYFQVVRSHLFKMLYRFVNTPHHSDLREKLAWGHEREIEEVIEELKCRLSTVDFNTDLAIKRGLVGKTTWYNRHRDERAAQRILSPPRSMTKIKPVDEMPIAVKLSQLKEKLMAARVDKVPILEHSP